MTLPLTAMEIVARDLAVRAHGDQKYDSGAAPYVVHLAAVRDALVEFGWGKTPAEEDLLVAAWLHDVLEDTKTSDSEIDLQFGPNVFSLVWAVTGVGKNRVERSDDAGRKMQDFPDSIVLKLADRLSNGRASKKSSPDKLFKMYRSEHAAFKAKLFAACPKDPRALAMWVALEKLFVEET